MSAAKKRGNCGERIKEPEKGQKRRVKMREFWKEICSHPEVTVTIDLYSMGIVFFNKKLHKRDYIVYF